MLYAEWKDVIRRGNLFRVVWVFYPGHDRVAGNERADVLTGEAVVGESITLDPPTVMATLTEWFNNNKCCIFPHPGHCDREGLQSWLWHGI